MKLLNKIKKYFRKPELEFNKPLTAQAVDTIGKITVMGHGIIKS